MNTRQGVFNTCLILFMLSCNSAHDKQNKLITGEYRIVGTITSDSVYDGKMSFYDIKGGELLKTIEYKKGKMDGERVDYHNGLKQSILHYENDKTIGFTQFFDSAGHLTQQTYTYYDIRVGSSIDYSNERPSAYYFYSFDNALLFSLNYEDLKKRRIAEVNNSFFHLTSYGVITSDAGDAVRTDTKYRLYLLAPPLYQFDYDLVLTGPDFSVQQVVDPLESALPFSFFTISRKPTDSLKYAIRLTVNSDIDSSFVAYKVLD